MKSQEEIQALKDSWLKNPIWNIEKSEGFEEYEDELLAFRKETEERWDEKREERRKQRARDFGAQTGIWDDGFSEFLDTFKEISRSLDLDRMVGDCGSAVEMSNYIISKSQVKATLLLAAQLKRIADVLESMDGRDSFAESVRIWGS